MNTQGRYFRFTIAGESHGPSITIIVDGVPPGLLLDNNKILHWLGRRRPGHSPNTSKRQEEDFPEITSGVFNGYTTGAPITAVIKNKDTKSKDYNNIVKIPRPGHADYPAHHHYQGFRDHRGSGIFSGRLTLGHVFSGAIAQQILHTRAPQIQVSSRILEIGGETDPNKFTTIIEAAQKEKDSVGGIIRVQVKGVPIGWGNPLYQPVESEIAQACFTIPAITAIAFGDGFEGTRKRGSEHNDPYQINNCKITLKTNNCGGVLGGLTTGSPISFDVAVKPTSSIGIPQQSVDLDEQKETTLIITGRHDPCIVLRVQPVLEACLWFVLLNLYYEAKLTKTD